MDSNKPFGVALRWWLAGGCLAIFTCAVVTVMCVVISWAVFGPQPPRGNEAAAPAPAVRRLRGNPVGQPAPAFQLRDVDGREHTLDEYRGRPVLINFWATWCGPCRAEMPIIEAAYQQHKEDGLVVLAIDVRENPELARTFAGWLGVSFTILDDGTGDVAYRYRVTAFPTSFFVDREGIIRAWQVGAMDESALNRHLSQIME